MSSVTAVIKLTKLCNLRCNYCYEYPHLANPQKISLSQLRKVFRFLVELEELQHTRVRICWHGGEPTLLGRDYFAEASKMIHEIFGGDRTQTIQTNLLRLRAQELEIFEMVDHISVSFDAFGLDRVSANGEDSSSTVIKNLDQLRRKGIDFGAINVLTRMNIPELERIFDFYNQTGIPVRILPFYRTSSDAQSQAFGLSPDEVKNAYLKLIKLHMTKGKLDRIVPVADFVRIAVSSRFPKSKKMRYNKEVAERVLLFDTNGDVYSDGTAYDEGYLYGNVFKDNAAEILRSEGRRRAVDRAKSLMADACEVCEFWGVCSGIEVGEQTELEKNMEEPCPVWRPCINYSLRWLDQVPEAKAIISDYSSLESEAHQEEERLETSYDAP